MIGRWLREPLLQFLVIGLLLFLGYHVRGGDRLPAEQPRRIEVTADDLRQMQIAWLAQGRSSLTRDEMQRLVDERIHEEVLYREALALGFDKDDTIVRRRMAQKMEFLLDDVAAMREPTPEDLKTWYDKNADRLAQPARATFQLLYFSPDRRAHHAHDDAAALLAKAADKPMDWPEGKALADPFMFQDYYGDRSFDDVAKTFGPAFAKALFQVASGAWSGPIESGYGWHLVWVDSITPARVPPLEEVEADAKSGWIEDQRGEMRKNAYAAMKARYEIVVPEDLGATAAALAPATAAPQPDSIAAE